MARSLQRLFASTEQQGHKLLRLTVDGGGGDRSPGVPLRGYRRVEWIERALALSLDEAEDVSAWAAQAPVRATLEDAGLAAPRGAPTSAARHATRRPSRRK